MQERPEEPMQSEPGAPRHTGQGWGWLLSTDPLWKSHGRGSESQQKVTPRGPTLQPWPCVCPPLLRATSEKHRILPKAINLQRPSESRHREDRIGRSKNAFCFSVLHGGREGTRRPPLEADRRPSQLCQLLKDSARSRLLPTALLFAGRTSDRRRCPDT